MENTRQTRRKYNRERSPSCVTWLSRPEHVPRIVCSSDCSDAPCCNAMRWSLLSCSQSLSRAAATACASFRAKASCALRARSTLRASSFDVAMPDKCSTESCHLLASDVFIHSWCRSVLSSLAVVPVAECAVLMNDISSPAPEDVASAREDTEDMREDQTHSVHASRRDECSYGRHSLGLGPSCCVGAHAGRPGPRRPTVVRNITIPNMDHYERMWDRVCFADVILFGLLLRPHTRHAVRQEKGERARACSGLCARCGPPRSFVRALRRARGHWCLPREHASRRRKTNLHRRIEQADAKPAAPAGGQENAEKGGWSWGALAAMDGVSAHELPCLHPPTDPTRVTSAQFSALSSVRAPI